MRELLKEARDQLEKRRATLLKVKARTKKYGAVLFENKREELVELDSIIAHIDAYLAARLLDDWRAVPRAMLEEVIFDAYGKGLAKRILNGNEADAIAEKYGVKIEG